jgi:phosphoenolpyruvate carboxykinase (GTP)
MGQNPTLARWIDDVARRTRPDRVVVCDGSEEEARALAAGMVADGTLIRLDERRHPGSFLHRSDPSDVARTEHLTFLATESAEDAGPTNNWMAPAEAHARVAPLFDGAMAGRTMYVVPYLLGPVGSPSARVGVELTDSPYVALSMRTMTRMGRVALGALGDSPDFWRGLHSLGDLSPERRYVCHFPRERLVWSVGSGYGGNALLAKKCFGLRVASALARDEGWLAEHMLIVGVEDPEGEVTYVCAAFPSACGKTNLAMLVSPPGLEGWKVWTVGDDIAWLRVGDDGRLWAVNPEAGFFGVAPGTGPATNPNALATVARDTIFTNVALTDDGTPWWEGRGPAPAHAIDWRGRDWTSASPEPAAHPNARFAAPLGNCPSVSPKVNAPEGVPISAFVFGGRRARLAPLVLESFGWDHGVFLAATMASETTAAATGRVGVVRRDPMAMRPFCGYAIGDYFAHWLAMGRGRPRFPRIFHVNWFKKDASGRFLWPGFGENLRVLAWMVARLRGRVSARETPVGLVPAPGAIDTSGLALEPGAMDELLSIDRAAYREEAADVAGFLEGLGPRVPRALHDEARALGARLR